MRGSNTQEAWVVLGQICVRKKFPIKDLRSVTQVHLQKETRARDLLGEKEKPKSGFPCQGDATQKQ